MLWKNGVESTKKRLRLPKIASSTCQISEVTEKFDELSLGGKFCGDRVEKLYHFEKIGQNVLQNHTKSTPSIKILRPGLEISWNSIHECKHSRTIRERVQPSREMNVNVNGRRHLTSFANFREQQLSRMHSRTAFTNHLANVSACLLL